MLTFLGSIMWIGVFSYLMVWWAHQVGPDLNQMLFFCSRVEQNGTFSLGRWARPWASLRKSWV